jgi:putative MATE family efflux protein
MPFFHWTRERRRIIALAWPVVVGNLMYTLTYLVDMIMVGGLGVTALAAVGLGGLIIWVSYGVMASVATGTTALVARFTGARRERDVKRVLGQAFLLVAIFSVFLTAFAHYYSEAILRIMGADPEVSRLGGVYLRMVFLATFFFFSSYVAEGALRGGGDTRTPLKIDVVINTLNLVLDYLLIYGKFGFPMLGVAGAGIASAVSFMVGASVYFLVLLSGRYAVSLRGASLAVDASVMRRILRIGIPSSVERLVMTGSMTVYTSIIIGFGTAALAAHQVGLRIESLSFMPGLGFAVAATALVGQNLGAEKPERAYSLGWETSKLCAWLMSLVGVVLFLFPEAFLHLFTRDEEVVELGVIYLRLVAISQPALALTFVLAGGLNGAGDTRWVMYTTVFGLWFFRLPLAYLLGVTAGLGVLGAWVAMVVDIFARSLALAYRFRSKKWMAIEV